MSSKQFSNAFWEEKYVEREFSEKEVVCEKETAGENDLVNLEKLRRKIRLFLGNYHKS